MPPSPPAPPTTPARNKVAFGKPAKMGHRTVVYGPGGIGKTTLVCSAPSRTVFFDLDESLARLEGRLPSQPDVVAVGSWKALLAALRSDGWDGVKNIVIDSITRSEELAVAFTVANVMHEKGHRVDSIEGYGYGKGFQHVFDTFLPLLGDLDIHCRAGRNVFLLAHDCTASVPNPLGDDWIRYEPRLQNPASGKASIRLRMREWADHVLFLGYDIAVNKDGKATGHGSRTLYTTELPHCMAKCRSTSEQFVVQPDNGAEVWSKIIT